MQCRAKLEIPLKIEPKMIKVITDSYCVASNIKNSIDLLEWILYQAANIGILPKGSLLRSSSRTCYERNKTQIIGCLNTNF